MNWTSSLVRGVALLGLVSLGGMTSVAAASDLSVKRPPQRALFVSEMQLTKVLVDTTEAIADKRVLRAAPVTIDLSALVDSESNMPKIGVDVTIFPFSHQGYTVEGAAVEHHVKGGWTWRGRVAGLEHSDFSIAVNGHSVYGTFDLDGEIFILEGDEKRGYYISQPDLAAWPEMRCPELDTPTLWDKHAPLYSNVPKGASAGRTFDLLVMYTPAVASSYDEIALVNNAVSSMNQSFDDSGIDAAVRVVGYKSIAYTEPNPINSSNIGDIVDDVYAGAGAFSSVSTWRDDYGADLVMLIVDRDVETDVCGVGSLMWKETVSPFPDNSEERWLNITCDAGFATQRVFSHEIGHNLGALHDYVGGAKPAQYMSADIYGFSKVSGDYRDVMGSLGTCNMSGCTRVNRWSDPSYTYSGAAFGVTGDANLVDALDVTVPLAAAYRGSGDPTPSAPPSVTVNRMLCYDHNRVSWTVPTGTVGWYEMQLSSGSWVNAYRGPVNLLHNIYVSTPTSVRVRACNSSGCSAYTNGNQTATYTAGCL